jgi:two-component system response regulator YesN
LAYSVVIVDDEKWLIIDLLKSVAWEEYGFEVESYYTSSTAALEKICEIKPEVVFTDIRMPKLNGIELVEEARKAGINSEFVIISAYADFESAQKAIQLSVADYLLKPINIKALTELLITLKERLDNKAASNVETVTSEETSIKYDNSASFSRITNYIKEHASEEIYLSHISEKFYINKNYLCHLFQKNLNMTFSQYLRTLRVEEAKRLLKETSLSLEEIASVTGIGDNFYFNKVFKKLEGVSPGAYRKEFEVNSKHGRI